MEPDLRLDSIDRDGAIAEAFARLHGHTRADLLRGALFGGGALLAAGAAPAAAASGDRARRRDPQLRADARGAAGGLLHRGRAQQVLHGELKRRRHRRGPRARPRARLPRRPGLKAIKRPHFDFGGATEGSDAFRRTAVAFEDLAVAAYKGQAPHIRSRAYLASALAIHSVEARHAAWIRRLARQAPGRGPVRRADLAARRRPASSARTHFVMRRTSSKGPKFTG